MSADLHTVTITPSEKLTGLSVPVVFRAGCACGWHYGPNALKWTALAVQDHYVSAGLTNGRGLLKDVEVSDVAP